MYFDKDQLENRVDKKTFTPDKLPYNKEQNYYVYPMGQHVHRGNKREQTTETDIAEPSLPTKQPNTRDVPYEACAIKARQHGHSVDSEH